MDTLKLNFDLKQMYLIFIKLGELRHVKPNSRIFAIVFNLLTVQIVQNLQV